jgi:hypothetical protein
MAYKVFALWYPYFLQGLSQIGGNVVIHNFHPDHLDLSHNPTKKERALVERFSTEKPDIFWFAKDEYLSYKLLRWMRERSHHTKFVMWYGDQRGKPADEIVERSPFLDALLVNNRDKKQYTQYRALTRVDALGRISKAGIPYVGALFDCFRPDEFYPVAQERKYDLLFGGNRFSAPRFPLARIRHRLVASLYKSCNMVIYGINWKLPRKDPVRMGKYNLAMQEAKMTLGINHYPTYQYYSERIWHCMASGRMHITYYIPGMEQDFDNKKHCVWFKTIDEAKELVAYYAKHDSEREAIGHAGRELLLSRDTWIHRGRYLDRVFKNILGG